MLIGERLEKLRLARRMSLTELAEKSGVQIATLSRIENMKMIGTLESHIQIAKALNIDITELYKDLTKEIQHVELGNNKDADIFSHSDQAFYEILTKNVLRKQMMPTLIRIEPDGKTITEQNKPMSEKFIYVLDGHVDATVGDKTFNLKKNNTLYFNAHLPHFFKNTGKNTAKVLCVATPVTL